ncbi:hypothetical protein ACA910_009641 [Epithemia clementina (nom. ined.)]
MLAALSSSSTTLGGRQNTNSKILRCIHGDRRSSVLFAHHHAFIPPPPSLSLPVWSLATPAEPILVTEQQGSDMNNTKRSKNMNNDDDDDDDVVVLSTSMNIVTFCTAVSVAPPKKFIASLYHGTRTKDFFCHNQQGVLQLLRPQHASLVPILGKRSGYDLTFSKSQSCAKQGFAWIDVSRSTILPPSSTSSSSSQQRSEHQDLLSTPSSSPSSFGESFWRSDDVTSSALPYAEFHLLPECATYLHLKISSSSNCDGNNDMLQAGDHVVVLCDLMAVGQWNATTRQVDLVQVATTTTTTTTTTSSSSSPRWDTSNVLYTGFLREARII